ncbi:hypothetical protein N7474_009353 [Penicillium riverlandense]|uniref:uncharacterized protein n=1 Tax=Penicillium riverlandense TaxID=1903569 RepID=UPI002548D243|nr:uncharacterized protein N7474_009353 [Penicillium riverlandense]KAJ5808084.1 hypothetical protein N7474_009353 [Penicillium riverlandense]
MRPPRLIPVLFCLIFLPIFLTFFSALSSPRVTTPNTFAGRTSGLHALFSFNVPSSLFPPSAIISLTDDNSTFFLARPAAFGPLLPGKGLSGQLWVGSGFSEDSLVSAEGELGCSDIPGWGEGANPKKQDGSSRGTEQSSSKSGGVTANDPSGPQNRARSSSQGDATLQNNRNDAIAHPSLNDGTDDHLHHPLPESGVPDPRVTEKYGDYVQSQPAAHADIQSLQETAEIQGKVVLLSRGGCGFLEKAKWAQRRGGIALIVGDDTRGGNLVTMYARGDTSNVTIPALFTSHTTAHLLSSLIPGHSGSAASLADSLKSSQAKLDSQPNNGKQRTTTTATSSMPSPTSTRHSTAEERASSAAISNSGFFRTLGHFLGLCSDHGASLEDSRRPPSSGNIDWMMLGSGIKGGAADKSKGSVDSNRNRLKSEASSAGTGPSSDNIDGDGFVIGVQDWRDPDLMPSRSNTQLNPSSAVTGPDSTKTSSGKDANSTPNLLQGGSITPGSGEYQSIDKSSGNTRDSSEKGPRKEVPAADGESRGKGWFSNHFGWGEDEGHDPQPSLSPSRQFSLTVDQKTQNSIHSLNRPSVQAVEHEGLWVTLTPTSMSTSPFFDTLLVLVVSPLLTLTVVYVLLLLRSRIRRRRWRAPKSVVERLPVRTYHTISRTSSSDSSPRPSSPGSASATSPLLTSSAGSPRPQSQTTLGAMLNGSDVPSQEKLASVQSGSTLWRRKYTGRQIECVVCLEEYVDGQSRVMSLPCGHEFHAECITPWLTTRRRTCPICKGDVVRSLTNGHSDESGDGTDQNDHFAELDSRNGASSAPVLITGVIEDHDPDTEQNAGADVGPLDGHAASAPQSSWRNLASFSFSALSGDTIWHQARADRNR